MESKIIHFDKSQINEADYLLGRAFYNDPAYTYIILEEGNRRKRLVGWLCTLTVRYGLASGHVYTTADSLKGVAVWIPPGAFPLSFIRLIQVGIYTLPFQLGLNASVRVIKLLNEMEEYHKRDTPWKHWYLSLLGVDPVYQSQGIGSSLVKPILKQADIEGLPCYLETFTEKNVRFYHKHGFAVVTEVNISKSNLRFWTMKRKPQN
ncbi:GNAT family N-acetyltransferase [Nostoc sp. CHAB 5834]|nr:GNAT family N-acetyltransferase [Nostoc sp. CHAB 5834]